MKKYEEAKINDSLRWEIDAAASGTDLAKSVTLALLIPQEEALDLIDFGSIQVNGRQERLAARLLSAGDTVQVHRPRHGIARSYEIDPRRILYRDNALLAYDKEPSIPSQQTPYDAYNNLYAALGRYLATGQSSRNYVGLHHRLDQETSGVMVFTLEPGANRKLGRAFEMRRVVKDYLAWVPGHPEPEYWACENEIGRKQGRYATVPTGQGKPAKTLFDTLARDADDTLIWARPLTGRTHQIRLHLAACGHPILGDRLHGAPPSRRLYLHAYRLRLPHPVTGKMIELTAPVPPDWPEPRRLAIPDAPRS
jgi:23S rRNA pseudouridine1911/1915/1917 synthase